MLFLAWALRNARGNLTVAEVNTLTGGTSTRLVISLARSAKDPSRLTPGSEEYVRRDIE
jgi:hypothetical protein